MAKARSPTSLGLNGIVVTRQRTNKCRCLRLDATEYFRRNTETPTSVDPASPHEPEDDRVSFASLLREDFTGAA